MGGADGGTVLVVGATGQQGGAVARHLLAGGTAVRALVRPGRRSGAADALRAAGAELVEGMLDDEESLVAALTGASAAFAMTTFAEVGPDGEARQGATLVRAAERVRLPHLVYASVASADQDTGIPHFASKAAVEARLAASEVPHTVLRPVAFMENWLIPPVRTAVVGGTLAQPLRPDTVLQEVAVDDIGAVAALALDHPDEWIGVTVELAGDALTMPERAARFTEVLGRPVHYRQLPWETFAAFAGEELTVMQRWFDTVGYRADPSARPGGHRLLDFPSWLGRSGWATGSAVPA